MMTFLWDDITRNILLHPVNLIGCDYVSLGPIASYDLFGNCNCTILLPLAARVLQLITGDQV